MTLAKDTPLNTPNTLFCTRPFEWFEIHPNGDVFLCCPTWLKRPIGNLLNQSIAEIWNSPVALEIRKSILNGSFHNCNKKRCPFLTTQTAPVTRAIPGNDAEITGSWNKKTAIINEPPKKLNLCYDHSCNLACPSCRRQPLQATGPQLERARRISDIILDQLIPTAQEITLSGFGDPFGSPTYLDLLQRLNRSNGKLPNIRLHSNGQLWTRKRWEGLANLHQRVTEAEISVDAATAVTYATNRRGGSFAQLLENLDYLAGQPFRLTLSMVVQTNNYREIPAFVELAEKFQAEVYLSRLVNWGTFEHTDFMQRAVHLPTHPQYRAFRELVDELRERKSVRLGNQGLLPDEA
ncbi:MAG: SPASM domain-containing protein [Desulfuromonas sp.]|nr:SPASM domain-containing protein [Desulfuromonas sp.]